jgi:hypothetical protein
MNDGKPSGSETRDINEHKSPNISSNAETPNDVNSKENDERVCALYILVKHVMQLLLDFPN